jgi:hypothetical protein
MKNKFTGPLAEPIYREDWYDRSWLEFSEGARTEVAGDVGERERWDAASRAQIAAEERRIAAVKAEKLALLASELEALDARGEPDWRVLAERLAVDVVPGLMVLDKPPFGLKPGRPKSKKALLVRVVDQLRRDEGLSIFAACCELSKRPGHWHKAKPRSLEQRYHEGMREWREQRQRSAEFQARYKSCLNRATETR